MNRDDMKMRRAVRRAHAMQDAGARRTWSGSGTRVPNKKREASRRACRDWRMA